MKTQRLSFSNIQVLLLLPFHAHGTSMELQLSLILHIVIMHAPLFATGFGTIPGVWDF